MKFLFRVVYELAMIAIIVGAFVLIGFLGCGCRMTGPDWASAQNPVLDTSKLMPPRAVENPESRVESFSIIGSTNGLNRLGFPAFPCTNFVTLSVAPSADSDIDGRFLIVETNGVEVSRIDMGLLTSTNLPIVSACAGTVFMFRWVAYYSGGRLSDLTPAYLWPPVIDGFTYFWFADFPVTPERCDELGDWISDDVAVDNPVYVSLESKEGFHGFRLRQPDGTAPLLVMTRTVFKQIE